MTYKGAVSIIANSPDRLEKLASMLDNAGIRVLSLAADTDLDALPPSDILLVDVASPSGDDFSLALQIDQTATPFALTGLGGRPQSYQTVMTTRALDVFTLDDDEIVITTRLLPLLRLATMQQELHRRETLIKKLGYPLPDLNRGDDKIAYDLLFLGTDDQVITLDRDIEHETTLRRATNTFDAEHLLENNMFEACIIDCTCFDDVAVIADFCSRVRMNPRLFNLPVITIAPEGYFEKSSLAYDFGATCHVVDRPDKAALTTLTTLYIRRQRQRWLLRFAIERLHLTGLMNEKTGAWSEEFFSPYLDVLLADAVNHQKPLTIVYFRILDLDNLARDFGDETPEKLMRQIANWIAGMVRVEDMLSTHDGSTFILALPDTMLAEAQFVMQRVANILTYTDFTLADVYQPITVSVELSMAERDPGDDVEGLLKRARIHLE